MSIFVSSSKKVTPKNVSLQYSDTKAHLFSKKKKNSTVSHLELSIGEKRKDHVRNDFF